jgi:hypothetical protein
VCSETHRLAHEPAWRRACFYVRILCEDRLLRADLQCCAGSPQIQASGAPPSERQQGQPGPARASQGDREGWVNEDGASPKGGSVGSKHEETVIVQAQDNISTVTFPTSEVYKACGAARTIVGA